MEKIYRFLVFLIATKFHLKSAAFDAGFEHPFVPKETVFRPIIGTTVVLRNRGHSLRQFHPRNFGAGENVDVRLNAVPFF